MSSHVVRSCPHCDVQLDHEAVGQQWTSVGPAYVTCPSCSGMIKTYRSEWKDKSPAERARYEGEITGTIIIAVGLFGVLGGGSLTAAVNFLSGKWTFDEPFAGLLDNWIVPVSAISLLVTLWVLHQARREVRESLMRTDGPDEPRDEDQQPGDTAAP